MKNFRGIVLRISRVISVRIGIPLIMGSLLPQLTACQKLMIDQPRYEAYEKSDFFKDLNSSRPLVEGTIPRNAMAELRSAEYAKAQTIPIALNSKVMKRGQERYLIYCSVCHSPVGDGEGIVTQRGFPKPPSFHIERLQKAPAGHFYNVITLGYGRMYRYGDRIKPEDRWAIVAYIRALQFSQNVPVDSLSPDERQKLQEKSP